MRYGDSVEWRDEDLEAIGALPVRARAVGQRRGARKRPPWIRIGLTSVALIALIAAYAPRHADVMPQRAVQRDPPVLLAPPPPWRELAPPPTLVAVHDESLLHLPLSHRARVHVEGALQDIVEIGAFRSPETHFRLVVDRDSARETMQSFFVELALGAAHAGLAVARSLHEDPLATRRGAVEVARVWLENGETRQCLAFRAAEEAQAFRRFGWLCAGEATHEVTREDLACAIDGIDLLHRETGMPIIGPAVPVPDPSSACTRPASAGRPNPDKVASAAGPARAAPPDGPVRLLPVPPRRPPPG